MACPKWGQDVKIQRDNQWLLLLNIYNKKLSAFLCILALHFVLSKYIDGSLIITCHLNAPLCNAVSPRLAMYHTVAWQQGYHHQWPYQDYPTVQCHQHTSHLDMTHWNPNIQNISLNLLHIFPVKYQLKVDFIHELHQFDLIQQKVTAWIFVRYGFISLPNVQLSDIDVLSI